jgi:hypothetical protein
MLLTLCLLQAAAQAPDIELKANVRARSLTIEKKGDARLTLTTNPDGGNIVAVQAPKADGRKTIRDVNVALDAKARIADPMQMPQQETPPQQ